MDELEKFIELLRMEIRWVQTVEDINTDFALEHLYKSLGYLEVEARYGVQ